jgi:hypothetical protein
MKKPVPAPARLVELPPEHALASLAVLVESVPHVPSAELPLVKWRVRSTLRRRVEWRRRALRVGVVGTLLFLAGGVVGAMVQPALLSKLRAKLATSAEPPRPAHGIGARARRRAAVPAQMEQPTQGAAETEAGVTVALLAPAAVEQTVAAGAVVPAVAGPSKTDGLPPAEASKRTLAASTPVARAVRPSSPRAMPSPAVADSEPVSPGPYLPSPSPSIAATPPLSPRGFSATSPPASAPAPRASEQALLTQALHSLSVDRDPKRALVALDEHASRFGAGALAPEAARLRTWALLLSGNRDAALAALSRQSSGAGFEGLPSGEEYRVLRGELHAGAGRWREALADFDLAVVACLAKESSNGSADRANLSRLERALWGRASARSHLGDPTGAANDLREYLRRFPQGRFAGPAARALKGGR